MVSLLRNNPVLSLRPLTFIAVAILFAGAAAWHGEIFSSTAWAFDHITQSYLVRYIDTVGMGIGACFG
ncbi:MAG: hypothetical protein O3B21_02610 [Proteobacteria bacterium]|nr:hypothetical protein [Pseudomonadota bacterium]MDA1354689.1 hypothetical protein [Pseudomonadota bacterium]